MANKGNTWGSRGWNPKSKQHRTKIENDPQRDKEPRPETSSVSEEADRGGRSGGNQRAR